MKNRFCWVVLLLLLSAVALPAEDQPAVDPAYGAYPKEYKRIIGRWLETHLIDPTSAVIDWLGEPKPGELPSGSGAPLRGYLVEVKINSRNQFGAPTGKQAHTFLIRDGEVLKATGY